MYTLKLMPSPERRLLAQPESVRAFVGAALARLAERPTALGKRRTGPLHGQIATFKIDAAHTSLYVTVTFLYGQDEQTLFVEHLSVEYGE